MVEGGGVAVQEKRKQRRACFQQLPATCPAEACSSILQARRRGFSSGTPLGPVHQTKYMDWSPCVTMLLCQGHAPDSLYWQPCDATCEARAGLLPVPGREPGPE